MPATLPAGAPVKRAGDTSTVATGKVIAATDPNDAPPADGRSYVRVKWANPDGNPAREWVAVDDLEMVTT